MTETSEPAASGVRRALGLISGTSMDGVDLAILDTDGRDVVRFGPIGFLPYTEDDRAVLRRALVDAGSLTDRLARTGVLGDAERRVTERHAEAVLAFLREHAIEPSSVSVVGFHGQTVLHRPEMALTVQIGDGAELASRIGIDVVADLRAADMVAGGQGAPLVPVYHQALAASRALAGPVLFLNIGGVSNITYVAERHDPVACDTGPGNALLDDLMLERTGQPLDRDGATAALGVADEAIVSDLLNHPYFSQKPPKSLDRNAFSRAPVEPLGTADAAATLTAFTAASIAAVLPHLPAPPIEVIVCGGGARNPTLMLELTKRLPCRVSSADQHGWSADAMEAQAFAYLAVRSLEGLPLSFPSTTGVAAPVSGGTLYRA
ncbi:anhydro-N-acetylmuramic acid kinase [Lichenihabitans sp. PAMC28606]|uniref:anhydro-N-acetylmuramic acid kinase n=1 Tax=Lichenihabitans sp. PAMC28606 TaxID=2880932 RepID=UPI001D09D373|nr:anhydro-N-acetylmuramic acid kinase [Lichenihabitans sp. PAMC28606]UDL95284.1 anhydro-N-acetylmuramic acid kinase [Lichenihabitans sp. PAMC28606]